MTMLKTGLIGSALLVFATQAQAQTIQPQAARIGHPAVTEQVSAGRQAIEIDMAALTDPAPRRAPTRFAAATVAGPAAAEPAATVTAPPPRKRFAHKAGQYEDAPLAALLASTN